MIKILKISALFLLSMAVGMAFGQTSIIFSWTGTGNPGIPACSATVTTSCISGFTISDVTNAGAPVVLNSAIPATALTWTYTVPPLTAAATHTYGLATNAKDSGGSVESSAQVTAMIAVPAVPPNPPTGFTAVP